METVMITIMAAVSFSFMLKLTFHRPAGAIALALAAASATALSYDFAASQSKTQIADWLGNPELMLDISVWLTADVAMQICFCSLYAKKSREKLSSAQKVSYAIFLWFPGLLIFPVLFATLTQILFALPGSDFATVGLALSAAILAGMPAAAYLLKKLMPETDLRLELMFMTGILISILGIVATVDGRTAAAGTNSVEWDALAGVLTLLAGGCAAGLACDKIATKRRIKKIQNYKL